MKESSLGQNLVNEEQLNLDLRGKRYPSYFKNRLRVLTEYSGRISSVGYLMGSGILTAKAGLNPDMDTAAGISFIAASAALYLADKYPTAAFRLAGGLSFAGTLALTYGGIDFDTGQIVDWGRIATFVGSGTTSALIGFQKEIANAAEKAKASKNPMKRALASTQRYPVALAVALDCISLAGLGSSGMEQKDRGTLIATGAWGVATAALFITDPRLRTQLREYMASSRDRTKSKRVMERVSVEPEGALLDNRQFDLFPAVA